MLPSEATRESVQRLFIALPVPTVIRDEISELIAGLRKGFKFIHYPMTWTRPEAIHVTLAFLGSVPGTKIPEIVSVVKEIAGRYRPMTLKAHEIGVFPDWKRPRVLWVGIGPTEPVLSPLQAELWRATRRFAEKEEGNKFRPHLTIGRFKSHMNPESAKNIVIGRRRFKTERFEVSEIVLYRSVLLPSGAKHDPVHTFSLAGDDAKDKDKSNDCGEISGL